MKKAIEDIKTTFISNKDLSTVKIADNNEPLVNLKGLDKSIILETPVENLPFTGDTIYLRNTVAKKIFRIQKKLSEKGFGLKIVDGYRPIEIQQQYWKEELEKNRINYPSISEKELEEITSIFIAKPSLSLHPTGGAIDLTIVDSSMKELWMGTKINEFDEKSYSQHPEVGEEALNNRKILFELMQEEEFYSLPSEWWHFSYGTIDWASYYKKQFAIYGIEKLDNERQN